MFWYSYSIVMWSPGVTVELYSGVLIDGPTWADTHAINNENKSVVITKDEWEDMVDIVCKRRGKRNELGAVILRTNRLYGFVAQKKSCIITWRRRWATTSLNSHTAWENHVLLKISSHTLVFWETYWILASWYMSLSGIVMSLLLKQTTSPHACI